LLFSATWKPDIQKIASDYCPNSIKINIGNQEVSVNQSVSQKFISFSDQNDHFDKFFDIISELNKNKEKTLIFCAKKHGASKLHDKIKNKNITVGQIHGNVAQNKRESVLADFTSNKILFLVATDVASRGIDVSDISCVINYDFPSDEIETYVHRIGRTGRAGKTGDSITFIGKNEDYDMMMKLKKILDKGKQEIPECIQHYLNFSKQEVAKLKLAQKEDRKKQQATRMEAAKIFREHQNKNKNKNDKKKSPKFQPMSKMKNK
jgi:superfamily II DNA/RNA helicase